MKYIKILILLFIVSISYVCNAEEYSVNTLIPVDTVATVNTEKFNYRDFIYKSSVDSKGNSSIVFASIDNNTINKAAVSINLLLFDQDQKNIGYVTYCSDRDLDSNYNGFKIMGKESVPFSIQVTSKYFAEGKSVYDVKYVAVKDENKYCQIGGYDKYQGLTIDQISNGVVGKRKTFEIPFLDILKDLSIVIPALIVIVAIVVLYGLGVLLNNLHKKMYAKSTILAYIPILNFYIMTKMAFGTIVAFIYMILFVISWVVYYLGFVYFSYIIIGLLIISFLVVLIKLFTNNYNLFYFEPSVKVNQIGEYLSTNNINNNINIDTNNNTGNNISIDNNTGNNNIDSLNDINKPLDLSYSNKNDSFIDSNDSNSVIDNSNNNTDNNKDNSLNLDDNLDLDDDSSDDDWNLDDY